MKKFLSTAKKGFIDPISLITIGILVVGLVVTTFIVKNPDISLDIRQWAKVIEDSGTTTKKAATKKTSSKTAKPVTPNSLEKIREIEIAEEKKAAPAAQSAPIAQTPAKTCTPGTKVNTAGTCPDGKTIIYVRLNADCVHTTTDECPTPPETIITPTPTNDSSATPEEIRLEKKLCAAEGGTWNNNQCQTCQPGAVNCSADTLKTCNSSGTGWDSQTCPADKTCDANLKTCVRKSGTCIDPCANDANCGDGNYCYKPANACPVCKQKAAFCTPGAKQCSGNYAQICNNYGTSWLSQACQFGCDSTAKTCKPDPSIISQADCNQCRLTNSVSECSGVCSNIGKKIIDYSCTPGKNECSNGNLKICSNSGTWGLTTCSNGCENGACKSAPAPAKKVDSNAGLIATYNTLNAVTFGAFGNYVQTYQNISAQNPQASYLQQAFNPQGIAASAQLGVVLTAEGAAVAAAGPAAQAIAGLPVAALMAQNALAGSSTLQTAVAVATLSQFPASIIACQTQGADSPACQYAAMGITAGYYSDVIGSEQALQTSAQQVQNVVNQGFNQFINSSMGNTLFGNPQIGPLDSMYSFNEYTLTSRPQLPSELSPLETHIRNAADLINQGKYTEAIQLLENQQLAAELGVTIDSGSWAAIPPKFSTTAMTNDDFINLANRIAASGKHDPGIVTLPSPGYYPITEDYIWGTPLPEPLVREQATLALEEWVHELQMRNNTLLGIPYTGGFSTTQHEDEIALYLYDTLKMQLSKPFLTRPGYNREILGLPGYNLTNFPTP